MRTLRIPFVDCILRIARTAYHIRRERRRFCRHTLTYAPTHTENKNAHLNEKGRGEPSMRNASLCE